MLGVRDESVIPVIRDENVELAGYKGLAQMLDKARLADSGELRKLNMEYPSENDKQLLQALGMDADVFRHMAVSTNRDDTFLLELKKTGVEPNKIS
jgi:ribosomal protein S6